MALKLKEIAAMAGVSEATASLALNSSPLVKTQTRERIQALAAKLGYIPNALASGLKRKHSGAMGLVIPDATSAFYGSLIHHIDRAVRVAGYTLITSISNDSASIEQQQVERLISARVEGILIVPVNKPGSDVSYPEALKRHAIPFAFVTSRYAHLDAPFVMVDLAYGARLLVRHLLDLGRRRILFLSGSKNAVSISERVRGYRKALKEYGIDYVDEYVVECPRYDYDCASSTIAEITQRKLPYDAVITLNDMMALAVLNYLLGRGTLVPLDVAVAGYDNTIFSSVASLPITTVNQDIARIADIGVGLLVDRIRGGSPAKEQFLIKPELIVRTTTAPRQIGAE